MRQFHFTALPTGGRLALTENRILGKRQIPTVEWPTEPRVELGAATRYLRRLAENGDASDLGDALDLPVSTLLGLPGSIATQIGLPPVSPLSLSLSLFSRIEAPDGEIRAAWTDSNGRRTTPERTGMFVRAGSGLGRLSAPVYALIEAVEGYNATRGKAGDERITAWTRVQHELEPLAGKIVESDRLLRNFRIFQAGAFALDVRQTTDGPDFDPVLMSAALRDALENDNAAPEDGVDATPEQKDNSEHGLLTPDLQRQFIDAFSRDGLATRPSYVLARNTYLVVEPELRLALDLVKRVRRSSATERGEFVKNPRGHLAPAVPDGGEAFGTIFIETRQYSDRVTELGLWEKPRLDWIKRQPNGWLPEGFVLAIGASKVPVTPETVAALVHALERAIAAGSATVEHKGVSYPTGDVETAIDNLRAETDAGPSQPNSGGGDPPDPEKEKHREVLLGKTNLEDLEFSLAVRPRTQRAPALMPEAVLTAAKPHQNDGFRWLVESWKSGLPGVLLADDMGLGKTLQALAFLAWFRDNRKALPRSDHATGGPILVVAPTALLRNWQQEAGRHLAPGSLGQCLEVFGTCLSRLKVPGALPEDALALDQLRRADWVLTTYETLANYHRAFARVPFAIAIFDEMQKIKAPDTINTHAAKVINADFVLGLTGTPIENRIEDLWCIMDRVAPGFLGALKPFSAKYGGEDADALKALKGQLDTRQGARPPLMLRRMKHNHLEGLPTRNVQVYSNPLMPPVQAEAYRRVVVEASSGFASKGDMLRTIHRLRGVSLHPRGAQGLDPYDEAARRQWVAESARVTQVLAILADIKKKSEKALVFIEDRAVQTAFAAITAAWFELSREPDIINGEMAGDRRQQVVDRFQASPPGFAVLVLSPKAAGIGLTITSANHVIHLSRWWNPAVEDQCNDRVYRIGQIKPVTVHVPLAVHPDFDRHSFDLKLDELLERKRHLSREMLVPPVSDGDTETLFGAAVGGASARG